MSKVKYCLYGVLKNGEEEKFRFEYTDRVDANRKQQELRNILMGVRFNPSYKAKYLNIVIKEEVVDEGKAS